MATPDGSGAGLIPVEAGHAQHWQQEKQVVSVDAPEAVPDPAAGLIPIIPGPNGHYYSQEAARGDHSQYHEVSNENYLESKGGGAGTQDGPRRPTLIRRFRKKVLITSALVLICIIAAVVVGGVVGTRKSSDSSAISNNSTTSDDKSSVDPKLVRPNSRLSATGWRETGAEGRFNIRLFYQGGDDLVRYSSFSSSQSNWSQPTVAGVEAIPGGSLAACSNIHYDPVVVNLFYLDKSNRLKAQNFAQSESSGPAGTEDTTVPSFPPLPSARLSCYLPFVLAQESTNNNIRQFDWDANWNAERNSTSAITGVAWSEVTHNETGLASVYGSAGSSVVALPIKAQYFLGGGFVYRTSFGSLGNYALDGKGDPKGTSWDANVGDLFRKEDLNIPSKASIGAFTVARDTTGTNVNTYILYQDTKGTIQVVWQDDYRWEGPQTYPALGGADKDTDITCVTQQAWDAAGVWLKTVSLINRCYFQSRGAVKEVVFDGKGWKDVGFVPIK